MRELKRNRRVESRSKDSIDTIEELNKYLSDFIDDDVDVTSKNGAYGVHNPNFGYLTMTMRAKKRNGEWVIECLVPDTEAIDWSGYVDDAVARIKRHSRKPKDESSILNGMLEECVDYILNNRGDNTEIYQSFTLPISKNELEDLITDGIESIESELEDFAYDRFFDEIKERLESTESRTFSRLRIRKCEAAIRSLNSLFKILKSHQDTSVARNSIGMVWKGDVTYNRRNETEDGKIGDFVELGFSLSPDGKEMAIYETYSGKKKNIRFVEDFVPALKELGIGQPLIEYLCHGTGLSR